MDSASPVASKMMNGAPSDGDDDEAQVPDMTRILDGLFIGNLAAATTLHERPELGFTHVLSVCPQNRGQPLLLSTAASPSGTQYSSTNPRHCSIIIDDSETQDIILHLPAAVAFIRDALQEKEMPSSYPTEQTARRSAGVGKARLEEGRGTQHKVLVHCVMGISRSATVVCAYLMATRHLSPAQALAFVRRRRPQVHPNYGFYRQLAVFAECEYFATYSAPARTHPAYNAWVRRKKRDVSRYLTRVGNVVEIDLGGGNVLSMTDDFPTEDAEAASLLGEIEATHFLTVSPSTLPPLPPPPPKTTGCRQASSDSASGSLTPGLLGHRSYSDSGSSSSSSSSSSSRSSSFSSPIGNGADPQRSVFSGPSTASTSMSSLFQPSTGNFAFGESPSYDEELEPNEPNFLSLTGVRHYHIGLSSSSHSVPDQADMLLRLNEACAVIDSACNCAGSRYDDAHVKSSGDPWSVEGTRSRKKSNVLVHCSTESRAALVMCAYLMHSQSLSPRNAYGKLESALPLFNATKSFLDQLELFYGCGCAPSRNDPCISAWIAAGCKGIPADARRIRARSTSRSHLKQAKSPERPYEVQRPPSPHKDGESEEESESDSDDGEGLRRKIGTPARCGSFAAHMAQRPSFGQNYTSSQLSSEANSRRPSVSSGTATANASQSPKLPAAPSIRSTPSIKRQHGVDGDMDSIDKLLRRVAGVGRPDFTLDAEAFRGTLRGLGLRSGSGTGHCERR